MTIIIPEADSKEYVCDGTEINEPSLCNGVKRKRKIWKNIKCLVLSVNKEENLPGTQLPTQSDWIKKVVRLLNESKRTGNLVTSSLLFSTSDYFRMFT